MRVVGLIVEYNPLHNGHQYHFQLSKKTAGADAAVAVMSGNFLQRGEPAIVNKWARTRMALSMGVDLVLELPVAYCTQNAEVFAFGAVSALDSLGLVDTLCFGSESGEIGWIKKMAKILVHEPQAFKQELKILLSQGFPYPKAYAQAAAAVSGTAAELMSHPNNILGLNYCMALERLNSRMEALTIARKKAGYHQEDITDDHIASATAIRKLIAEDRWSELARFVPSFTYQVLSEEKEKLRFPMRWDNFYPLILYHLACKTPQELREIHEMEEGIEHRLKRIFSQTSTFHELMDQLKTKRYTWNRLQRLLLHVLLHIKKKDMRAFSLYEGVPYLRVLGFNQKGRELLHLAKKRARVPIISKIPRSLHPMLELDIRATTIYSLGYPKESKDYNRGLEYKCAPIVWE